MPSGKIKKVVAERGFGFMAPHDGSQDVFFHCSVLPQKGDIDNLVEGEKVSFEVEKTDDGKIRASVVTPVG